MLRGNPTDRQAGQPRRAVAGRNQAGHLPPPGHNKTLCPYDENHVPLPPANSSVPALPQRDEQVQKLLGIATLDEDAAYGFLHTYAPKHDLHLLYIDGLSAGKTGNGTLDTQDLLLLNASWPGLRGPMGGEYTRATGLCNLSSTVWDGRIDGILRMEGGFEIILCDFERHLERKDMISINHKESDINTILGGWTYIKAVVARYHGIGSSRVALDYSDFVSVFSYPEVGDLFQNDVQSDYAMPRLQNVKSSDLDLIRDDITAMILRKNWDEHPKENWQQTADLIVKRYSKPLHYLHTNEEVRRNASMLVEYLGSLLRPFIDDRDRNSTLETHRCVAQFVPDLHLLEKPLSSLAHRTIHDTTHHICDTLIATLCISSAPANQASRAIKAIDDLVSYLQWTTWKECGTCPDEEVCFIPIWPLGAHDDHAHPTCRNQASARERQGYWGRQHGPWLSTGRNAQMNHNDS